MNAPPFTAEILRNARIQLRPKRLIAAVVICAAISLTTYAYYVYLPNSISHLPRYNEMFQWIVILQIIALVIGGGIYCLQSVHREMVLNTFDYQRVTRLTPLELALGKLFGAPALMTLVALCMLPAALFAALAGGAGLPLVLEIYAIVLLGSIAFQAFALTVSVFLGRGTSAGAIIFFLAFVWISAAIGSSAEQPGSLALHGIAPFAAASLTGTSGWPEDIFSVGRYRTASCWPRFISSLSAGFFWPLRETSSAILPSTRCFRRSRLSASCSFSMSSSSVSFAGLTGILSLCPPKCLEETRFFPPMRRARFW